MLGQLASCLGQVGLQLREFCNERLQRAQLVIQHQSNGADHLSLLVLQRHPCDDQRLTTQLHHVQQDRLAAAHDLTHQAVRDDLLDLAAQRVVHALQPERGQVLFVDPGDPGLPVHRHRALAQAGRAARTATASPACGSATESRRNSSDSRADIRAYRIVL